jgi:hypothetical protein
MAQLDEAMHLETGGVAYFTQSSWTDVGVPKHLSWSFVPDGTSILSNPGLGVHDNGGIAGPSELFSRMDSLFDGNRASWISLFEESFERWSQLIGTTYSRVTLAGQDWDDGAAWESVGSPSRGDIRIAMRNIDGPWTVLAYNYYPQNGDMLLDRNENWSGPGNNYGLLRNVIMHEHGHGIGLRHVCPSDGTKLMEPVISTSFDGPQHDDIRGGQHQHGDPYEQNDTPATAVDLGPITIGSPITVGTIPPPSVPNTTALLGLKQVEVSRR